MEFELLGWPGEGPKLALDYRRFSYAGKFVMSNTGKAVAVERSADRPADDVPPDGKRPGDGPSDGTRPGDEPPATPVEDVEGLVDPAGSVVGAVAFNEDRTDPATAWIRYVTVRADRRGEGIGPRLVSFVTERLRERGYDRVTIAVNNPFSYEALYRAGFTFTGDETGIAELVLAYPGDDRSRATYQAGLDVFRGRGPENDERAFLARKEGADPPDVVEAVDADTVDGGATGDDAAIADDTVAANDAAAPDDAAVADDGAVTDDTADAVDDPP